MRASAPCGAACAGAAPGLAVSRRRAWGRAWRRRVPGDGCAPSRLDVWRLRTRHAGRPERTSMRALHATQVSALPVPAVERVQAGSRQRSAGLRNYNPDAATRPRLRRERCESSAATAKVAEDCRRRSTKRIARSENAGATHARCQRKSACRVPLRCRSRRPGAHPRSHALSPAGPQIAPSLQPA